MDVYATSVRTISEGLTSFELQTEGGVYLPVQRLLQRRSLHWYESKTYCGPDVELLLLTY
jgi:hypothetical protein